MSKAVIFSLSILLSFSLACDKSHSGIENTHYYLDQEPPKLLPKLFARGIISMDGRYEHGISFSPDLHEVYFSANLPDQDPSIFYSILKNGKWSRPEKANFTKGIKVGEMHPFVSPSGKKIHFAAHDKFTEPDDPESVKTWFVERDKESWSEAKQLDSPINNDFIFYTNEAKNGDLFYTNISQFKMYYSPKSDSGYQELIQLDMKGLHGFVSPSQDYLVINASNNEDSERKSDIYVYFRKEDGSWSNGIALDENVNTNYSETCPSITPDGKFLFFSRYNEENEISNFYWVSTEVIYKLRPQSL